MLPRRTVLSFLLILAGARNSMIIRIVVEVIILDEVRIPRRVHRLVVYFYLVKRHIGGHRRRSRSLWFKQIPKFLPLAWFTPQCRRIRLPGTVLIRRFAHIRHGRRDARSGHVAHAPGRRGTSQRNAYHLFFGVCVIGSW